MKETKTTDNPFALPKNPSMKRRAKFNDYHDRRMYMITMVTEGRRKLFGEVIGDPNVEIGKPNSPHIELTECGKMVEKCWREITLHEPAVSAGYIQLMPDHFHGILFVRKDMKKHLGDVLRSFKIGCNKGFRSFSSLSLGSLSLGSLSYYDKALNKELDKALDKALNKELDRKHGLLFERGYNDKILYGEGQLARWENYLRDNPRRLLVKRMNPDLFRVRRGINVAGMRLDALGNLFLLSRPEINQVQVSRKATEEQLAQYKSFFMEAAQRGAVAVSPGISKGEKAILRMLYEMKSPVIVLLQNGFGQFAKPGGAFFDACADGRLLLLAPWEYDSEHEKITRQQCLLLNEIARRIALRNG